MAWFSGGTNLDASSSDDRYSRLREQLVEVQLAAHDVGDPRVLEAMRTVPREEFVPRMLRDSAYVDSALPIGCDQTISQPCVAALMCELAQLQGYERVLEVGAGSGYVAALLALLAREVVAVERIPKLAKQARRRLARLGYDNATVEIGDGSLGWPARAPFDAILVSAGASGLPLPLVEHLAPGGRLVIPIGRRRQGQTMYRFTARGKLLEVEELGAFSFVPLITG